MRQGGQQEMPSAGWQSRPTLVPWPYAASLPQGYTTLLLPVDAHLLVHALCRLPIGRQTRQGRLADELVVHVWVSGEGIFNQVTSSPGQR